MDTDCVLCEVGAAFLHTLPSQCIIQALRTVLVISYNKGTFLLECQIKRKLNTLTSQGLRPAEMWHRIPT
jgi:hypothetical protein